MAAYIDSTYVDGRLGTDVRTAIEAIDGVDLTSMIEDSSDVIRGILRHDGMDEDAETPADVADGTIRLATWYLVRVALSTVGEAHLPLPADYDKTPEAVAYRLLEERKTNLNLTASTVSGHGGFKFTGTSTSTTGDAPPRATRAELEGF